MELVRCSITTIVTWEGCSNPHSSLKFWLADRHTCKPIYVLFRLTICQLLQDYSVTSCQPWGKTESSMG